MDRGVQSRNRLAGVGIERIGPHLDARARFAYRRAARRNVGRPSSRAKCGGGGGLEGWESRFGGGEGKNAQTLRTERFASTGGKIRSPGRRVEGCGLPQRAGSDGG